MTIQKKHKQQVALLLKKERALLGKSKRELNRFFKEASAYYAEKSNDLPNYIYLKHKDNFEQLLRKQYQDTAASFRALVLGQLELPEFRDQTEDKITQWIETNTLAKSQLISDTSAKEVKKVITSGIANSDSDAKIAKDIRGLTKLSGFRADAIARTETHNAASYSSLTTAQDATEQAGVVMLKRWIPTLDNRTRSDHFAMADYPAIPLDEAFNVGGYDMQYPGDDSAPAEQVVNCRCMSIYEPK